MLLVLAEVSGAHILDFIHLLIIPFLQRLSVRRSLVSDLQHVTLQRLCLSVHLALKLVFHFLNRMLEVISVLRAVVLQHVQLEHVDAVVAVNFLID